MGRHDKPFATFHKPFEGRAGKLPLVGFCLLAPAVHNKLYGIGIQREVASLGLAAAFKRMTRFLQRPTPETPADVAMVANFLRELEIKIGPTTYFEPLKLALDGDSEAQALVNEMGSFGMLFRAFDAGPEDWKAHHFYLIAVERAGKTVLELCTRGAWQAAAEFMEQHPVLRQLLWPRTYERVRTATSLDSVIGLQVRLAWEAHLGFLAAWDCARGDGQGSIFTCLMPSHQSSGRNPTSLFYDELQRRLGAPSIGAVFSSMENGKARLDRRTLERWSAGSHSPEMAKVRTLLRAYGMHHEGEPLYPQLWCARHLNLLGYYAEDFIGRAERAAGPGVSRVDVARTFYPFEHETFEAWVADRYPAWLAFHREHAAQVKTLALAKGAE